MFVLCLCFCVCLVFFVCLFLHKHDTTAAESLAEEMVIKHMELGCVHFWNFCLMRGLENCKIHFGL